MKWSELDFPTRAGFIAGVIALIGLIVPPLAMASALVAIGFSGAGWQRSRQRDEANPVARSVLLANALLIVVVLAGTAIYAAAG